MGGGASSVKQNRYAYRTNEEIDDTEDDTEIPAVANTKLRYNQSIQNQFSDIGEKNVSTSYNISSPHMKMFKDVDTAKIVKEFTTLASNFSNKIARSNLYITNTTNHKQSIFSSPNDPISPLISSSNKYSARNNANYNNGSQRYNNNNYNGNFPTRMNGVDSGRISFSSNNSRGNRSVRAMALMNHARQENSYIPQDIISASLKRKQRSNDNNMDDIQQLSERMISRVPSHDAPYSNRSTTVTSGEKMTELSIDINAGNNTGSLEQKHNLNTNIPESIPEESISETGKYISYPSTPILRPQESSIGFLKKNLSLSLGFNLKIEIEDETDWVKVNDEEDDDHLDSMVFDKYRIEVPEPSPIVKSQMEDLTSPSIIAADVTSPPIQQQQTQHYTHSGTLYVDGFNGGIGANGIIRPNTDSGIGSRYNNKLSMKERLIVICKLGQGASSVVYKALDLTDMKLVALKMITVHDKDKRNQMVRELGALFQLIRENSRRESGHLPKFRHPDKYIVDFYDAFR
eukprot:gene9795-13177_t